MSIILSITGNHSRDAHANSALYYRDFLEEAYWADAMKWAVRENLIVGDEDERKLKPDAALTEAQYVSMMLTYFIPEKMKRTSEPYEIATSYHLSVKGTENHKSNQPIRRGDAARLLVEGLIGKEMPEKEAIQWLYDQGLSAGTQDELKTYLSFKPNQSLTRAEGATLLYQIHISSLPKELKRVKKEKPHSIKQITIGDRQEDVEEAFGTSKRTSLNEYGTYWHTYHKEYDQFFMVSYAHGKVIGLYTNHDLFSGVEGITLGSTKEQVHKQLGEPLTSIEKQTGSYVIEDEQYDTYLVNHFYMTFFYDLHDENKVAAVQLIEKNIEQNKQGFYGVKSEELRQSFEEQLFDLVNATRRKHGLSVLKWDESISKTAVRHSSDMATNQYFDHTNLEGQSPFDRIHDDGIQYKMAGENIAMGQFSSVFAHEALLNSLGHRRNILQPKWRRLGIGVSFDPDNVPYFTQNFYTP